MYKFILLNLLLLTACGGRRVSDADQRLEEKAAIFAKIIESIDTVGHESQPIVGQISGLQHVMDSVLVGKTGWGMFYLLNSGCSVCIGELIEFNDAMVRTGLNIPIYILPASRNHVPTIEYYLEQSELASGVEMGVVLHTLPGEQISSRQGTVVVTYGERVVEQFVSR